jgi:hypothetical protein
MKKYVLGQNLGPKLLKALGVDASLVASVDIHVRVGEPVAVTVTRYVGTDEADEMVTAIEPYLLIAADEGGTAS